MSKECQTRSYDLHNGIELQLMLRGAKPFAAFYKLENEDFDATGGQNFDMYVKNGTLKMASFSVNILNNQKPLVYTLYCCIGEEWRFNLYKELKSDSSTEWSMEKEFIEGILLGYSIYESIEHVEKMYG